MSWFIFLLLVAALPVLLILGVLRLANWYLRAKSRKLRARLLDGLSLTPEEGLLAQKEKIIVGFFHPYCNAGGGGERVLWAAIAYLQRTDPNIISAVYTGDTDVSKSQIISKVETRFGIILDPTKLAFVFLPSRHLVDDGTWKRATLLGQSFGSVVLTWEALDRLVPDVFIDTMGYAFSYTLIRFLRLHPIVRLQPNGTRAATMPIGAYVHYPTISTDMLRRVRKREEGVTNQGAIANSGLRTGIKLLYYRVFSFIYAYSLSRADSIVANGSWTKAHVDSLVTPWLSSSPSPPRATAQGRGEKQKGVPIVYPPCDTDRLQELDLEGRRERIILSVAQFRPEKNHSAQLRALHSLFLSHPAYLSSPTPPKLVLLGSVRSPQDEARVDALRTLTKELGITEHVQFVLNASYDELVAWLGRASVGVSSMVDEHFGIGVVEMMAAGLIPVVHASAGPLLDIVVPSPEGLPTGFLYSSEDRFASSLHEALSLSREEEVAMRQRAREGARRFGTREFERGWEGFWGELKGML